MKFSVHRTKGFAVPRIEFLNRARGVVYGVGFAVTLKKLPSFFYHYKDSEQCFWRVWRLLFGWRDAR